LDKTIIAAQEAFPLDLPIFRATIGFQWLCHWGRKIRVVVVFRRIQDRN
jgi:hypothetical protein